MTVVDEAALVKSHNPKNYKTVKTFQAYCDLIFIPAILRNFESCERCDIVWDVNRTTSLKAYARQQRGFGERMRVSCETVLPINWKSFLRVDDNKTALFHFLANQISLIDVPNGKVIITTLDENVLVNGTDLQRAGLEPCNHEEADTRMLLHCQHAYNQEARKLMCVATDMDVVVIAIASASRFIDCEAWIEFGHRKHMRYIPLHSITASLGQDKSLALPFFHAFSGCDTISSFKSIGKKMHGIHGRFFLMQRQFS